MLGNCGNEYFSFTCIKITNISLYYSKQGAPELTMKWLVKAILITTATAIDLNSSGSTLVCDAMRDIYEDRTTDSYECNGSGKGKKKLIAGEVAFAVCDYPLTKEEESLYGITSLPLVAVEVVVIYNTGRKGRLLLDISTVGNIFTGVTNSWNVSEITSLNPALSLPHEKIKVAVRTGLSGTSYILTEALRKFGFFSEPNAQFCDALSNGTCDENNFFLASGTSDVLKYVHNTPHSIGYVGVRSAMEYNLPFAGITVNKQVLLPTTRNARDAIEGTFPEYSIPNYIPLRGYPIEGLAYFIFKNPTLLTDASDCEKVIALNDLLLHIYSSKSSADIFAAHWMIPMAPTTVNLINDLFDNSKKTFGKICKNVIRDNTIPILGSLIKSSYYQSFILVYSRESHHNRPHIVNNTESVSVGINVGITALSNLFNSNDGVVRTTPPQSGSHDILFGMRELIFLVKSNKSKNIPARLTQEIFRGIFNGTITNWNHSLIRTPKNAFADLPKSGPIRFVIAEEYESVIEIVSNILNISMERIPLEIVTAKKLNELYLKIPILTCRDLDSRPSSSGVLYPIVSDNENIPFRYRKSDFEVHQNGLVSLNRPGIPYPFTYVMYHRIPKHIIIDLAEYRSHTDSDQDPCQEYILEEVIPYLRFCAAFGGLSGSVEVADEIIKSIYCNGRPLYPQHSESSILMVLVSLVSGLLAVVVVVIAVYFKWKLGTSEGELKSLVDNNKLAVQIAEAIAEMRLEDIFWITELQQPDKLQECFGKIISNISEYRRYLPDAILYHSKDNISESGRFIQPPENDSDVTIVFTDVQSSTALWDALADGMAAALRIHHKVIRRVIKELDGYEIKTIGDAFMVAFTLPETAVTFGLLVQERLLHAEWPSQLQSVGMCADEHNMGSKVWGGLRVRVGIHRGPVNSERDTITGRKDYSGQTVNKAARVEAKSIGGLVTISEEVFIPYSKIMDKTKVSTSPLGSFELKGITGTHELHCIVPALLAQRLTLLNSNPDAEEEELCSPKGSRDECEEANTYKQARVGLNSKLEAFFKSVIGCVAFIDLRHTCHTMTTVELNSLSTSFVDFIDVSTDRYNGAIHSFYGNGLLVGWNTGGRVCQNFLQSACRCSSHVLRHKKFSNAIICMGISAGAFATGNAGVRKRTAALSSPHVVISQMLSRSAAELDVSVLCIEIPGCPSFESTLGIKDTLRPVMKWKLDHTSLSVIYEINTSLIDDWGFSSDSEWGTSSIMNSIFKEIWNSRDMSGLIKYANDNPKDAALSHISKLQPIEYFNITKLVQAATTTEVSDVIPF